MTLWRPGMRVTAARLNGLIMDWTPLADLGTFASGFAPHATLVPRMRKIQWAGTEVWEYGGDITAASITINTVHLAFTFSSEYRPASTRIFTMGGNSTSFFDFWVQLASTGALNVGLPTGASSSASTRLCLAGMRVTNPET